MVKELVKLNLKDIFISIPIMAICQLVIFGLLPEEKSYIHLIIWSLLAVGFLKNILKSKKTDFLNILPVTREEILKSKIITLLLGYIIQLVVYTFSLALGYQSPNIVMLILISIIVAFYIIICIYSIYVNINTTLKFLIDWIPFIALIALAINLFERYMAFQMYIVFSLAVLSIIGMCIFKKFFYKKLIYCAVNGDIKNS